MVEQLENQPKRKKARIYIRSIIRAILFIVLVILFVQFFVLDIIVAAGESVPR